MGETSPVRVDRAGAGDEAAAGQLARRELVDDREREHQPRRRPPDVAQADPDVTGPAARRSAAHRAGPGRGRGSPPARRPPSAPARRGGRSPSRSGRARCRRAPRTPMRAMPTVRPETATSSSPTRSADAAGESGTTAPTTTRVGDRQLRHRGELRVRLGGGELLGVLLAHLVVGLAGREDLATGHDLAAARRPRRAALDEGQPVRHRHRRHVEVPGRGVGAAGRRR